MIRKWIRKIVNEVMEETMNEIVDNVDEDIIEERAAEKVAQRISVDNTSEYFSNQVMEHLDLDASDIAQEIDLNDLAYHVDKDDIARELSLSDLSYEIDLDDLASYVSGRMSDKIDVDYKEVASNLSMDELACEIDVNMIACLLVASDKFAEEIPNAMKKALALHDQDITHMFQVLADALNNVAEERREVEE